MSDHGLGTKDAVCPTGYTCKFEIDDGVACGSHFQLRKQLNAHKKDTGHIKKKGPAGGEEGAVDVAGEEGGGDPAENAEQAE